MIELKQSGVVFNEDTHTYTLGDKVLQGITGLIKAIKFPNKYKDIPQHILEAAAEEGTKIHKSCEIADQLGVIENYEAQAYLDYQNSICCYPVANEYTVTDGENWASNIDCVWANMDDEIILVDIKTTYELDEEYLSWQLSIYAHFFEKQNPGLKVSKLYGILLFKEGKSNKYGKRRLVKIKRKSDVEVLELLSHVDYNDEMPVADEMPTAPVVSAENALGLSADTIKKMIFFEKEMEDLKKKQDELKAAILKKMEETGTKSVKIGPLTITYVAETTTTKFDSKTFKVNNPSLYSKYAKESKVKPSVRISVKD